MSTRATLLFLFATVAAAQLLLPAKAPAAGSDKSVPSTRPTPVPADPDTLSGNFFAPSLEESGTVPSFSQPRDPRSRLRGIVVGMGDQSIPNFHELRRLPSLNTAQRRQVNLLLNRHQAQIKELNGQMRELRGKFNGQSGQSWQSGKSLRAFADPAERQKVAGLRDQIQNMRQKTWQELTGMLTSEQLQEFDQMRKGELVPATFARSAASPPPAFYRAGNQDQAMEPGKQRGNNDGGGNQR